MKIINSTWENMRNDDHSLMNLSGQGPSGSLSIQYCQYIPVEIMIESMTRLAFISEATWAHSQYKDYFPDICIRIIKVRR